MASTEEVVVDEREFGEEGKVVTDKESRHSHFHGNLKKRNLSRMESSRVARMGHAQMLGIAAVFAWRFRASAWCTFRDVIHHPDDMLGGGTFALYSLIWRCQS